MANIKIKFDYRKQKNYTNESILKGILHHTTYNSVGKSQSNLEIYDELDPSLFYNVPKILKFNIEKACNWIQRNSHNSSQKACAKYVRLAIEEGFHDPKSTEGHPTSAWHYMYFLPKIGFRHIGDSSNYYKFKNNEPYNPVPGDIAVYMKNGNPNEHGHICMWTGIQWCSDFKQDNMIVYNRTPYARIFRYG